MIVDKIFEMEMLCCGRNLVRPSSFNEELLTRLAAIREGIQELDIYQIRCAAGKKKKMNS